MLVDHVYDEIVLKQHFSPINGVQMFVRELADRGDSFQFKLSLVTRISFFLKLLNWWFETKTKNKAQHLMLYINSLNACEMVSDVALSDMDAQTQLILKYSGNNLNNKKSVIRSQFEVNTFLCIYFKYIYLKI